MPKVVGYSGFPVVKRWTCKNCGAINEYAPKDVVLLWEGKDYGGGSDGAMGFNCAGCGKEIIVKSW